MNTTEIDTKEIDSGQWKLELNKLETEYYRKRLDFYNLVERYYRQSPYGSYVSEDELIIMLDDLREIRMKMGCVSRTHRIPKTEPKYTMFSYDNWKRDQQVLNDIYRNIS